MGRKSFAKKYSDKIYGQLWSELESNICSGVWSKDLFSLDIQAQEYTVQEIKKKIKRTLPDVVSEYLHVLALSNHRRPVFDAIRYSGQEAKTLAELYQQKRPAWDNRDSLGHLLITPDRLSQLERMVKFLFAQKIKNLFNINTRDTIPAHPYGPFTPREDDDKDYEKCADELLEALIEDAILLYLSKHQEPVKAREIYTFHVAKVMQNSKLQNLIAKILQGAPETRKQTANRRINAITCSIIESLLPVREKRNAEEAFIGTIPELLIVAVLYLVHTSSSFGVSFPSDTWQTIVEYLKHTENINSKESRERVLEFLQQVYADLGETTYSNSAYAAWKEYNSFFSRFVNNVHFESLPTVDSVGASDREISSDQNEENTILKLTFLNYFSASPAQWKQALSRLSPRYIKKELPSCYEEIESVLYVRSQITADGSFKMPKVSRSLTAKDALIFPTEDLFWQSQGSALFSTITDENSNYSLLMHTFWELQKLLGRGYGLNKSLAIEYLNRMTGAVDIALFTGTKNKLPQKEVPNWQPLPGIRYGGGSIIFYAPSSQKTQNNNQLYCATKHIYGSAFPHELHVRGLKTKYILDKYEILTHKKSVECLNLILKYIFDCLESSNLALTHTERFNPYSDLDFCIKVILDGVAPYRPIRPSMTNEGIF